jgi:hypothetical protein
VETCVVRLLERSPSDRLDPRHPERLNLECGYVTDTAPLAQKDGLVLKEKGRMVSVLLDNETQLPEALHVLADLWARQIRRDPGLRLKSEILVRFDIVDGARGNRVVKAEELADWLHLMADKWGERRAIRRMLWRRRLTVHPAARLLQ